MADGSFRARRAARRVEVVMKVANLIVAHASPEAKAIRLPPTGSPVNRAGDGVWKVCESGVATPLRCHAERSEASRLDATASLAAEILRLRLRMTPE